MHSITAAVVIIIVFAVVLPNKESLNEEAKMESNSLHLGWTVNDCKFQILYLC